MDEQLIELTPHSHTNLLAGFLILVAGILVLDLFVLRRKDQTPSIKQAFFWTGFYILIALSFCGWIWSTLGSDSAMTFLTGYVVEMSLSIDNLFVFILIFTSLRIPAKFQHRVLFWGIIGALAMRALCIGVGIEALSRFEWLTFIFAAILIWAGYKTMKGGDDEDEDPSNGMIAKIIRKFISIKDDYEGEKFLIRDNGKLYATPLLLALFLVEASDVIFAVDSIPAVLAVTKDPFLVYTSNIFAILGLRSLYFVLAGMVNLFKYLDKAVAFILIFIGIKIGVEHWFHIPTGIALSVILGALAVGIAASLASNSLASKKE
jgi:tellurite resistance protein TerC